MVRLSDGIGVHERVGRGISTISGSGSGRSMRVRVRWYDHLSVIVGGEVSSTSISTRLGGDYGSRLTTAVQTIGNAT